MLNISKCVLKYFFMIHFAEPFLLFSIENGSYFLDVDQPETHKANNRLSLKNNLFLDVEEAKKLSAFRHRFLMFIHSPKIQVPFQDLFDTLGSVKIEDFPISYCSHFLRFGDEGSSKLDYVFFLPSKLANSEQNWKNNLESTENESELDRIFIKAFEQLHIIAPSKNKLLVLMRFFSPHAKNASDSNLKLSAAHITFFIPFTKKAGNVLEESIYTTSFLLSCKSSLRLRSESLSREKVFTVLQNTRLNRLLEEYSYTYLRQRGKIREGFVILDAPAIVPIDNIQHTGELSLPNQKISDVFSALNTMYRSTRDKIGTVIPSPEDETKFKACLTPEDIDSPFRKRTVSLNASTIQNTHAPDDSSFGTVDDQSDTTTLENLEIQCIDEPTIASKSQPSGKLGKTIVTLKRTNTMLNPEESNEMEQTSTNLDPLLQIQNRVQPALRLFRKRSSSFNITLSSQKPQTNLEKQEEKENLKDPHRPPEKTTKNFQTFPKKAEEETAKIQEGKAENTVEILVIFNPPSFVQRSKSTKSYPVAETPAPTPYQTTQQVGIFESPLIASDMATSKEPKIEPFVLMWIPLFTPFESTFNSRREKPFSFLLHQRLQESSSSKKTGDQQLLSEKNPDSIQAFFLFFKNFLKQVGALWCRNDM